MSGTQADTLTRTPEIDRSLSSSIDNALGDLADRDPGIRKNAVLSLISSLQDGSDITRALPSLEMALTDDSSEVRKSAAAALERYAFHVYGVHISLSHETAGMGPDDSASPAHYPLLPLVSKGAIVPVLEHSLVKVTAPCADHESSSHPEERNPGAIHLPHTPAQCPSMIGYLPKPQVAYAEKHVSSELVQRTPFSAGIEQIRRFSP
ncbi:MAG: HEAT repeat domain-containing protein, partial [bacterium]